MRDRRSNKKLPFGVFSRTAPPWNHGESPGTPVRRLEMGDRTMSTLPSSSSAAQGQPTTTPTPLYGGHLGRRVTVRDLALAKERGERWPMLTAYDALTAAVFDDAGIPVLLVGDSAGNVVYGYGTTLPVTMDELVPLVAAVVRGTKRALVVADMPFGS